MRLALISEPLKRIAYGYLKAGRRIILFLCICAASAATAAGIAFPLWYFAVSHREGYSIFFGMLILAMAATGIALKTRTAIKRHMGVANFCRYCLLPWILRACGLAGGLLGIYIIIILYINTLLVAAIPASILYFLIVGYFLYGKRRKIPSPQPHRR